jgi:Protein of unknown function (DUF3025)
LETAINHSVGCIDWQAPWLSRYKAIGEPLAKAIASGVNVHQALNDALATNSLVNCPVRFVPQADSQGAAAYESFIWQTKTVPSRDNLHDFFNGLVWLHFPQIKARLNELQAAAIAQSGVTSTRGKLRDALTLFDENSAFLIESSPSSPLLEAIRNKAWQDAFTELRTEWTRTEVIVFGHALLEKLVSPRKPMTAHVFCPPTPLDTALCLDVQLAAQLNSTHLATKPYAPLPVMGVPKWCAQNEEISFYDDAQVFRSAKLC